MDAARTADAELGAGLDRGPLHGIPYALKGIFDVEGLPTTCHSRVASTRSQRKIPTSPHGFGRAARSARQARHV